MWSGVWRTANWAASKPSEWTKFTGDAACAQTTSLPSSTKSTANAGGNHNLVISHGDEDLPGLLRRMGAGLLVTELLGHGTNMVTGDYSRGAAGFWVEGGEICYPVEEITIAGNLRDMFRQIVAVGNDVLVQGSKQCGSILIERMTVAGE